MRSLVPGRERLRAVIAAVTVLLVVAVGLTPGAASAAPAEVSMTAAQVNAMFQSYGDAGGHWTGGDRRTPPAPRSGLPRGP